MMGWEVPEEGWRKGPWTPEEDRLLHEYVNLHGDVKWSSVSKSTGLKRSGKSCRLRWVNYLRPGLKRCQITPQEEAIIVHLHSLWGNKWSMIARYLPGRTDNEIKNYWRTHFKRKEKLDPSRKARRKEYQMLKQKHKQDQEQHDHQEDQVDALACNEKHVTMEVLGNEEMNNMVFMYSGNYSDYHDWDDQRWPEDVGESFVGEEGLWSGLWNLDDSW